MSDDLQRGFVWKVASSVLLKELAAPLTITLIVYLVACIWAGYQPIPQAEYVKYREWLRADHPTAPFNTDQFKTFRDAVLAKDYLSIRDLFFLNNTLTSGDLNVSIRSFFEAGAYMAPYMVVGHWLGYEIAFQRERAFVTSEFLNDACAKETP